MALRDLVHNLRVSNSLVPALRTDGTVNGVAVDLRGFDAAMVVLTFGNYTDGVHTVTVQHSDDNVVFESVTSDELQGDATAVSDASVASTVQAIGYAGSKRYLRAVIVTTGATTGALSAVNIVAGMPQQAPIG